MRKIATIADGLGVTKPKRRKAPAVVAVPLKGPFKLRRGEQDPIGPWADTIDRITDRRLTVNRLKLTGYIFRKYDRNRGCFWHGIETIAQATGMSRRTIYRCFEFWEDSGFLVSLDRNRGPGLSNLWQLALPPEDKGVTHVAPLQTPNGGGKPDHKGAIHVTPLECTPSLGHEKW